MQINKQLIAIIILASLLFSAVGAALFFFKKNQQTEKAKSELITVYIAKDDIPRDTLLTVEHLAQTAIAKEYILNTPLTKEEILGKFTNENIYKHEIFLKQKLDTQIAKEEKKAKSKPANEFDELGKLYVEQAKLRVEIAKLSQEQNLLDKKIVELEKKMNVR